MHPMAETRHTFEMSNPIPSLQGAAAECVHKVVHAVRDHLKMDVAFISEFIDDKRVFRHVDTKGRRKPIRPGASAPLEAGYCHKITQGKLPQLMPDTGQVIEVRDIPETRSIPVGANISVPLHLSDGHLYGTFCCFSFAPVPSLGDRDLTMMKAFADIIAHQIDSDLDAVRNRREKVMRITEALRSEEPSIVYQPMLRMADLSVVGTEALSRFNSRPLRTPDKWFAEARETGLGTKLELQAITNALAGYRSVWQRHPVSLALNISPQTIRDGDIERVIAGYPSAQIVLEITEHDHIEDYDEVARRLVPLRLQGVRVAVDDAGSGYASMRHILNLKPDIVKLDVSLTRGIDVDPMKRALAKALVTFCRSVDANVTAEGIETPEEFAALKEIGVHNGQGYLLHRPGPVEDLGRLLSVIAPWDEERLAV